MKVAALPDRTTLSSVGQINPQQFRLFTRSLVLVAIVKRHTVHLAGLLMDRSGVTGLDVDALTEQVLFLASDAFRCIVGQTLLLDGGISAIMPLTGNYRDTMESQFGQDDVPGLKGNA